jgi:sphingomyelin phosphodiesterase acid-like 3
VSAKCIFTRVVSLALFICFGLAGAEPGLRFLWISDLHFNPVAEPKIVDALAEAETADWARILGAPGAQTFSGFGQDTNWALLSSSFEAMRKMAPNVKFTVVTGDLLVHRFREKFQAAATKHDDEDFQRFTLKTAQFVAEQVAALTPGTPVLVALGNNDSDCGDYTLQPGGAFLRDGSASITKLLGSAGDADAGRDWAALGSYSVAVPGLQHRRAIVLNSVYFSARYQNACAAAGGNPAADEMRWLETQVAAAKAHKEKVWLMFHIAPGLDGYATAHQRDGGTAAVPMWKPIYTEQFRKLMTQYRDTVMMSLAGHEHVDDFRLIGGSLVQMTPGISPVVGQNPAFRVATYRNDGVISDEATYYLANLTEATQGAAADWKLEYEFAKTWGARQVDFASFRKLAREIESKPDVRERWTELYSVSGKEETALTKKTFAPLFCATVNETDADFQICLKRLAAVH